MNIIVKEKAIRQLIKEAMFSTGNVESGDVYDPASSPVSISDVVDPSAVVTDPDNPNYTPQNKSELQMSLNALVANVADDKVADIYNAVKDTVSSMTKKKVEDDMGMNDTKVEALIRYQVRKMLREAAGGHTQGLSSSGLAGAMGSARGRTTCEDCDGIGTDPATGAECKACEGSGEIEAAGKKYDTVSDVGGATLQDIAKGIGQKSAGKINDMIDSAMAKVKDRIEYLPDNVINKIYGEVMKAYDEYVQEIIESGELTPADIKFLADHPDVAYEEFEGLKDFRSEIDSMVTDLTKKYKLSSKPKNVSKMMRR